MTDRLLSNAQLDNLLAWALREFGADSVTVSIAAELIAARATLRDARLCPECAGAMDDTPACMGHES